jgi:hypothetical protein
LIEKREVEKREVEKREVEKREVEKREVEKRKVEKRKVEKRKVEKRESKVGLVGRPLHSMAALTYLIERSGKLTGTRCPAGEWRASTDAE